MHQKNLKLKAARVLQGLTQEALGEKVGRSQAWVCQLEAGLTQPDDLEIALLCRVLRVHPGELNLTK